MSGQTDQGVAAGPSPTLTPYQTECLKARIEHLKLIQAVITRMATASSDIKKFTLPVIGAMLGYAFTNSEWPVLLAAQFLIWVAWYLDARYLWQEQCFRKLYDRVRQADPMAMPDFAMTPEELLQKKCVIHCEVCALMKTWSTKYIYFPISVVTISAFAIMVVPKYVWPLLKI